MDRRPAEVEISTIQTVSGETRAPAIRKAVQAIIHLIEAPTVDRCHFSDFNSTIRRTATISVRVTIQGTQAAICRSATFSRHEIDNRFANGTPSTTTTDIGVNRTIVSQSKHNNNSSHSSRHLLKDYMMAKT